MAPDAPLGEFELVVVLAVLHLVERDQPAFGSSVLSEIRARGGRPVARGAVYVTLDRLGSKGLLASRLAAGPANRGGRARRLYRPTERGTAAVRRSLQVLGRMQEGLSVVRPRTS